MNTGLSCILAAAVLSSAGGVPLLRGGGRGRAAGVLLALLSSGLGLCGIALVTVLGGAQAAPVAMSWAVPGGSLAVQVDGLSALFLLPVFLIAALASIYGLGYWRPEAGAPGRGLPWFQGLMTAGMVVLLLARNSVLFLLGWELM